MIRSMLSVNENAVQNIPIEQPECLVQGAKSKMYKPLLERDKCGML